ncbi:CHASE4 domain-containing protein [Sphingomonas immobilis]|uniref:histidine kinase n=1 Tax=Sphingomonas immobilis TaxID=3063997 RepID=A0ABT8ZTV6_9SPHN|nr:CHASE4 domain-containing protein [Sphingomonas sp. CA1-15]MDO7840998.1 CHASE4 domain-containing protein [Sphingomonas sp. CA1-15]
MAATYRAARGTIDTLRKPGSLGAKLVLMLTAIGVAGAIAITLLLATVIMPSFDHLEQKVVAGQVERTRGALNDYAAGVETTVRDLGDWDPSYAYLAKPTAAFVEENASPMAMANLGISGVAYIGKDGRVVTARWRDPESSADRATRAALIRLIGGTDFRRAIGKSNSARFFARLGHVVAAVGVAQVRRSDGSGDPRGYVLVAREISSAELAALLQTDARIDLDGAADRGSTRTSLNVAVPMRGSDGRTVASAVFGVPRDLSVLGTRMLMLAVLGSILLLALVLLMLRRMITRLVLRPLARVERHMQAVRASGEPSPLEEEQRRDEIGALGKSFNSMLRQLQDARAQIEAQSFQLGRSESGVAVMHNVRNALNPVSTILSQGIAMPPPVDRAALDRAIAELAADDLPVARRAKLLAFLTAAVEAEANDRTHRRDQLEIGREAMRHALEIIGAQQQQAHGRPELEACDVSDIAARNATIARYSGGVAIAFSVPDTAELVLANRVILSQVIGNVFSNAAEAIAACGRDSGTITVTIERHGSETRIAIRDDGEGFAPGDAPNLFQRGFSTRAHKSGGLGLHWCANAMNAMGGSLRLESAGRGHGAVAVLTLAGAGEGRDLAA